MNTDDRALADLIARFRELLAKVAPAPWTANEASSMKYCSAVEYRSDIPGLSQTVCQVRPDGPLVGASGLSEQNATACLIAEVRNALPTLLDRLEAFHAKPSLDQLRESLGGYQAIFNAIADAVNTNATGIGISVDAFLKALPPAAALQSPPPVVSPYERAAQIAETFRPRGENAKHFVDQLVCDIAAAIRREANNA